MSNSEKLRVASGAASEGEGDGVGLKPGPAEELLLKVFAEPEEASAATPTSNTVMHPMPTAPPPPPQHQPALQAQAPLAAQAAVAAQSSAGFLTGPTDVPFPALPPLLPAALPAIEWPAPTLEGVHQVLGRFPQVDESSKGTLLGLPPQYALAILWDLHAKGGPPQVADLPSFVRGAANTLLQGITC